MYTEQEFHLSRNSYFLKYYEKTVTSIKLFCRFHVIEFKPFIKYESLIFSYLAAPRWQRRLDAVTARQTSNVQFTCSATGSGTISYTWYKNGNLINRSK